VFRQSVSRAFAIKNVNKSVWNQRFPHLLTEIRMLRLHHALASSIFKLTDVVFGEGYKPFLFF
jgi:hypothetical protein